MPPCSFSKSGKTKELETNYITLNLPWEPELNSKSDIKEEHGDILHEVKRILNCRLKKSLKQGVWISTKAIIIKKHIKLQHIKFL